jgi:hypothetical protein
MKTRSADSPSSPAASIHTSIHGGTPWPPWLAPGQRELALDMFRSWCRSSRAERGKQPGAKPRLHLHSCFLASLAVGPNPSPFGASLTLEQDLGNGATPAANRRIALRPVPMQGRPHGFRRGARKALCLRWHETSSRRTPFAYGPAARGLQQCAPGQPDNQEYSRPGRDTMIQRCPFEECNMQQWGTAWGARFSTEVSSSGSSPPFLRATGRFPSAGRKNGRGVAELHRTVKPSLQ